MYLNTEFNFKFKQLVYRQLDLFMKQYFYSYTKRG